MGTSICRFNTNFYVPKPIVYALSLLSFIENLIATLLNHLGLLKTDMVWPENPTRETSESAFLIGENLPVMKFEELVDSAENCAVCLCEFEEGEEIRLLKNCRHVFHKACLDSWVDHDQKMCPLCRTALIIV